jgi:hypothetical protein
MKKCEECEEKADHFCYECYSYYCEKCAKLLNYRCECMTTTIVEIEKDCKSIKCDFLLDTGLIHQSFK